MKIGILTFHEADNYGAVLQAYALKETIKKIEEDVEIINYKQPYIIKDYKIISLNKASTKTYVKSAISGMVNLYKNAAKKYKFNSFRNNYMDISKTVFYNPDDIKGKDVYVVGSDQVWNSEITYYDTAFFLDFCNGNEKGISYAASIGKASISDDEKKFLKEHINNFDYISVREDSAVKILEEITDKPVHQVLDPTLLADKNIWDKFDAQNKINDKYLLVYMLADNVELLKIADLVSKKLNLKVVNISDSKRKQQDEIENIRRVGPIDYLSMFKNASFVVTNSFHGTSFSIIFNKDFITVPHKIYGNRMTSLLNLLKLNDRIITNSDELKGNYNYKVDYEIPNDILAIEKIKSFDFLMKSIKG